MNRYGPVYRYGYGTQYSRGGMGRGRVGYGYPRGGPNMMRNNIVDNNKVMYYQARGDTEGDVVANNPNFRNGSSGRSRPLARLVTRSRDTRGPLKRGESDAYKMEVTEQFIEKKNEEAKGPIPCVSVLDFYRITPPDVSQRRVCIPVTIAGNLSKLFAQCRGGGDNTKHEEIVEEDHKDDEEELSREDSAKVATTTSSGSVKYDLSLLKPCILRCPKTKEVVEIENIATENGVVKHLRSYMNVPSKEDYQKNDPMEKIELRPELMRSLERFLADVAVRYRNIKGDLVIPSLYSYSGERRFYYDLRRTRWGLRLHVSQVTDMHRNVIGIPLEVLVQFRDRLSDAIAFLQLEEQSQVLAKKPRGAVGVGKGRRKRPNKRFLRKRGPRKTSGSGKETAAADSGGDKPNDNSEKVVEEKVINGGDAKPAEPQAVVVS